MNLTFENYKAYADPSNGRWDLYRRDCKENKKHQMVDVETLIGYGFHIENLADVIATDMMCQKPGESDLKSVLNELRIIKQGIDF